MYTTTALKYGQKGTKLAQIYTHWQTRYYSTNLLLDTGTEQK